MPRLVVVLAVVLALTAAALPAFSLTIKSRGTLADLQSKWAAYKSTFVRDVGTDQARVRRPENGDDSVSEGMAYGMLMAVHFNERALFTKFWAYVRAGSHLNQNGLMNWRIGSGGDVLGQNSATDAELDFAYALLVAVRVKGWCEFADAANTLVGKIMSFEVDSNYVLKPGDMWGGSTLTNPSYFSPAYYEVFRQHTNNDAWGNVITSTYATLNKINSGMNSGTGLVPDWCDKDGHPTSGMGYDYKYDACRTPWRVSLDAWWFDRTAAKAHCDKVAAFFGSSPGAIGDAYTINGNKYSPNNNAAFVGPAACCVVVSGTDAQADAYWNWLKNAGPSAYFQDALAIITGLVVTGQMINPLSNNVCAAGGDVSSSSTRAPSASSTRAPSPSRPAGSASPTRSHSAQPTKSHTAVPSVVPLSVGASGTPSGTAAPVYIVVVLVVDLGAWNQTSSVAQIAEAIVAQLSLLTGIPRSSLGVQAVQTALTQARVSVSASSAADASALYDALESEHDDGSGSVAQKNGVQSASLESAGKPARPSKSDRAVSISTLVGIIVGCVLLATLLVVVVLVGTAMVIKYRRSVAATSPSPSSSSAELDANIMYSRNSL